MASVPQQIHFKSGMLAGCLEHWLAASPIGKKSAAKGMGEEGDHLMSSLPLMASLPGQMQECRDGGGCHLKECVFKH